MKGILNRFGIRFDPSDTAASAILVIMGALMFAAASGDAPTADEAYYIPSGYRYLTAQNARVGFEHPPLVRDIAAVPLLFLNLRNSDEFFAFRDGGSGRLDGRVWQSNEDFLFRQPVPTDRILAFSRTPMIL